MTKSGRELAELCSQTTVPGSDGSSFQRKDCWRAARAAGSFWASIEMVCRGRCGDEVKSEQRAIPASEKDAITFPLALASDKGAKLKGCFSERGVMAGKADIFAHCLYIHYPVRSLSMEVMKVS